jgi:CheY-like chemotaxis protein
MARRVLVVDNNKELVRMLCLAWQWAAYETISAYDGAETLQRVAVEREGDRQIRCSQV